VQLQHRVTVNTHLKKSIGHELERKFHGNHRVECALQCLIEWLDEGKTNVCLCIFTECSQFIGFPLYDTSRIASGVPKFFKNLLVMDGPDGHIVSRKVKLKRISTRVFSSTGECHIHLWLKKP
jgi:hypothetical protein